MELIHATFAAETIGRWTEVTKFAVDADKCRRYALATNDTNPRHLSGELAPPVFPVVATVPHVQKVLQAGLPPDVLALNRSVHGEQDIYYHRPIRPGDVLDVRARAVGIRPRSSGTAFVTQIELRDAGGTLVHEQYVVNFLRGVMSEAALGIEPPAHRMPPEVKAVPPLDISYPVDQNQTFRYAEASGDHSIYHLDDAAARAAGFPGIIVHGLCTMAFAGRAAVEAAAAADPSRVKRFAVRFSRPLFPGERLTTRIWADGESGGLRLYRLEAVSSSSAVVCTDGLVEVAADPRSA
jgi:acyl dehydratase